MQRPKYWLHILLFLITMVTTTAAGAEWMYGRFFVPPSSTGALGWPEFWAGLNFSIPFLTVLTVHEFGHYFVAKANRVRVTLPYYIPLWLGFGLGQSIGTMGAFIRIQEFISSRRKYFDIGIAGPLAGFVVALALLWYGFSHLPPIDYIFTIHPEYKKFGLDYGKHVSDEIAMGKVSAVAFGDNLLFWFFKTYVADPSRMPHPYEMVHYPYLLAGYLSLFFTSLNLIPIGQLDGGHVLYGLIGRKRFNALAPVLFTGFVFYAGLGMFKVSDFATSDDAVFLDQFSKLIFYVTALFLMFSRVTGQWITNLLIALSVVAVQFGVSFFFPQVEGYSGFLVFGFVLGRFLGIYHPETEEDEPLSTGRQLLGWLALLVFLLCFSPKPFVFS
ncbi:site-2 protease family protein [Fibrella sp. HMF5335]|uniref:Site-2 protease family protein n=1 Tax=Fibrella rubiginis TaxID=2817060 RepID=A0A939JZX5_9BACT|nr:site-2 protease family protein [Fibrella rubiginis]MBO0935497.1 site-2 protease family protein [Fibrella rubiginis]